MVLKVLNEDFAKPDASGEKARFLIPQNFYGREHEISQLMDGFHRASQGRREMMLVAGYSGIGKSSLVKEVHKPIVQKKGYFISGKFDQYQHTPYGPIMRAFSKLVDYLVKEEEDQLKTWRERIRNALGDEAQVLVEAIPNLELIIGAQPPVLELTGMEALTRFRKLVLRFLDTVSTAEHPLTLFLDDLQWVDPASLGLLKTIMMDRSGSRHLLVLGAYRDNEVSASHPLMLTLDELAEKELQDTQISTITIGPLSLMDTQSLVADTLLSDVDHVVSLAAQIQKNSGGNPFFIKRLLSNLYETDQLAFSTAEQRWIWNEDVDAIAICDNVAVLLAQKLETLPENTRNLLGLASCLGNHFDLETLSIISSSPKNEIAAGLWVAVTEELIIPQDIACSYYRLVPNDSSIEGIGQGRYTFSHDRIQEAAYLLLSPEERKKTHLNAGQLLLENAGDDPTGEALLDIVNHLNLSVDLISSRNEIEWLAALNLSAGMNAKKSMAYNAARDYFKQGIELMGRDGWYTHPNTMFQLYREGIEAEFLCGDTPKANAMFDVAVELVLDRQSKGQLYELMIRISQNDYAYDRGIELGLIALRLFDIVIPNDQEMYDAACGEILSEISEHTESEEALRELANGSEMTDNDIIVCCGILHEMWVCLFMSENPRVLFPAIKLIQLSISYGQSAVTAVGYIFFALIQTMQKNYDAAYTFGKLAMELKERFTDPLLSPKVLNTYCNFVNHYKDHVGNNIPLYEESHRFCQQSGEIWWGAWAASFIRNARLIKGDSLDQVKATGEKYADYIHEAEFAPLIHIMHAQMSKITNLLGETGTRTSFDTPDYNEKETEDILAAMPFNMGLFWHNVTKTLVYYLYGEKKLAMEAALLAEQFKAHDPGLMQFPDHFFFSTLVFTDNWENFTDEEKSHYGELIDRNVDQMNTWRQHCMENYRHRYLLIYAERERIKDKKQAARLHYELAIDAARENGYIHHEAMANECAARFHQRNGNDQDAKRFLKEARLLYLQWGAKRKIEVFDEEYPDLD
ncbi:AAA family ATPase [Pseudodesulfovibrio sp. zrk46]|uniref:ATP-binding protein n=1 Tax=Pseudodesulfovibrio sp. zrk46 TaxID=2725288 RepID=UPI001448EB48|nr:AAA family ATPase [Pseudodesulfovibrio sp. zrk46]QJB56901.1 AAA family ATPase [Pseudodesulfovibrio sp. zrk46]